jgi:hypothetical protein
VTCSSTLSPADANSKSRSALSQLNQIQKLKQKHGIDYDSHASYRFVER